MFSCRLTEFSRNKTLWDFPATRLPFAEFPLMFFPFFFAWGRFFLYGISPPFLYVFSRPLLLGVSPSFPAGVFCFSPRFFRQACDKENSRSCPGVFSREMTLSFSRTHSSDPDRRSSHRNPNRTYNSPSRKPKADR